MNIMEPLITNLVKIMLEIINYHQNLYSLLLKEKEVMIAHSIEELEKCTKEKETITLKLKILDESRKNIIKKLAQNLGIDEKSVTLTQLSQKMGPKYQKQLKYISTTLKQLVKDIFELNNENRAFVEIFMNRVKMSLSFLNQAHFQDVTYQNNGETKAPKNSGRMLGVV